MEWDNVGLLVGRRDKDVKKIIITLDATDSLCDFAIREGYDMIITHHPIIFGRQSRINDDTPLGRKLLSLIEAGICCYAMHTNFDTKGGMAKIAAGMLGLKNSVVLDETLNGEGIGQVGLWDKAVTLGELAGLVKSTFELDNVKVFGSTDSVIDKVAIVPGSGKSELVAAARAGAGCLITGDIGHHEGIDALELGLNVIDASHYGLEKIFMSYMYDYLIGYCEDLDIMIVDTGIPFEVH